MSALWTICLIAVAWLLVAILIGTGVGSFISFGNDQECDEQ